MGGVLTIKSLSTLLLLCGKPFKRSKHSDLCLMCMCVLAFVNAFWWQILAMLFLSCKFLCFSEDFLDRERFLLSEAAEYNLFPFFALLSSIIYVLHTNVIDP